MPHLREWRVGEKMTKRVKDEIVHDHNHDVSIDRGFFEVAWRGRARARFA